MSQTMMFEATRDSGKLAHHVAEVDDQDSDHHEKGNSETEFLADEIAKAFTGNGAHAGADFLNDNQS
jgi:hypothetical protein